MKKLNKLFGIVLAIVSLFAFNFAACDAGIQTHNMVETLNGKTSAQVYTEIIETIDSYGTNFTASIAYDIPCTAVASMGNQKETFDIQMSSSSLFKLSGTSFYEKTSVNTGSFAGEPAIEEIQEVWFVDDTAFLSKDGTKYKYGATVQALENLLGKDLKSSMNPIYDFSDKSFDDVKFAINKTNEEDIYFELILDGAEAEEFAQNVSTGVSMLEGAQFQLSTINYRFVIDKNGALDHANILFDLVLNMNNNGVDIKFNFSFNGTITFTDIGTTVVEAPADSNSYIYIGSLPEPN